eukprot:superscaffoldBa00000455_g4845
MRAKVMEEVCVCVCVSGGEVRRVRPKQVNNVIEGTSETRTADRGGEGIARDGTESKAKEAEEQEAEDCGERKALMGEGQRCESAVSCQRSRPVSSLTSSSTGWSLALRVGQEKSMYPLSDKTHSCAVALWCKMQMPEYGEMVPVACCQLASAYDPTSTERFLPSKTPYIKGSGMGHMPLCLLTLLQTPAPPQPKLEDDG